eukprot:586297-Pelagomonas_calceolata.AAC.3
MAGRQPALAARGKGWSKRGVAATAAPGALYILHAPSLHLFNRAVLVAPRVPCPVPWVPVASQVAKLKKDLERGTADTRLKLKAPDEEQ